MKNIEADYVTIDLLIKYLQMKQVEIFDRNWVVYSETYEKESLFLPERVLIFVSPACNIKIINPKIPTVDLDELVTPRFFQQMKRSSCYLKNKLLVSHPYTKIELSWMTNTAENIFSGKEDHFFEAAFIALENNKVYLSEITNEELQCRLLEEMKRMCN